MSTPDELRWVWDEAARRYPGTDGSDESLFCLLVDVADAYGLELEARGFKLSGPLGSHDAVIIGLIENLDERADERRKEAAAH